MDTQLLAAFTAVAHSGSFTAAAKSLHLSQPAISKRIAALESQLARPLFDRSGRRVFLTEAGSALLPRAEKALNALRDCHTAVVESSATVSGELVLVTSHHVGLHHLPPVLRRYVAEFPQVALDVRFLSSEKAHDAVLCHQADLAVVTLPEVADAAVRVEEIWHDPMAIMVASESDVSARIAQSERISETLDALATFPAIFPEKDTFTCQMLLEKLDTAGITPNIWLHSNHLETIRMLVQVGLGWSILPKSLNTPDAGLREIAIDSINFERRLGIVTHRDRSQASAANAFISILRQATSNPPSR